MIRTSRLRLTLMASLTGLALAIAGASTPIVLAALTPAQAQISADFHYALEPYGQWVRHPRWGEVWVPEDRPSGWRPYTYGRWVYTDEWGWYWVSDEEEEDWGWITYHYGRWAHDRRLGWFWIPGDEWAPAWVDWRRGDDYVGWAPLPPDPLIVEYDDDPAYWIFVPPRRMLEPRLRSYALPPTHSVTIIRNTVVINRTVIMEHKHDRHRRIAVNAGISPAIVAAARHRPVRAFRVTPHVLAGTQGVAGAVPVRAQELSRSRSHRGARPLAPKIQVTTVAVQPAKTIGKPQPLRKNERGRLGSHPPRAAQGAIVAPSPPPQAKPRQQATPPQGKPKQPATPPQGKPQRPATAPSALPHGTAPPHKERNQKPPATPPSAPPPPKVERPKAPKTLPPTAPAHPPAINSAPPRHVTPPAAKRPAMPPPVHRPPPPAHKPPPPLAHKPPPAASHRPPPAQVHKPPPKKPGERKDEKNKK